MRITEQEGNHLDRWLKNQFDSEDEYDRIGSAMLRYLAGLDQRDHDWWMSQTWWKVYDAAGCRST